MEIYLVRHGSAAAGPDDAARALSEEGRKSVRRVADRLRGSAIHVDRIEHSPLRRAAETAEIFGEALGAPLREVPDLIPGSDIAFVRDRLEGERPASVMLVGHNPFMESMAALLLTGDPESRVLTFHTAGVAHVAPSGFRYSCDWLLSPLTAG